MTLEILFRPGPIGDLEAANRIVMAPMTRARAHGDDVVPTPMMATYYEQRASAGLIISEGVVVSPMATGYVNVPGLYSEAQVAGWAEVTRKVHAAGGKIFAQIWHVGRISHPDLLEGRQPLAPSAINAGFMCFTKNGMTETATPREMTVEEIRQTVDDFRRAAENAVAAGFDGIELHAANGYLFHQFLAPSANQRTDAYGGSIENRSRFLFEVLDAVCGAIGSHRCAVRLNPVMNNVAGIILDEELDRTFTSVVGRLNGYDLAYLHVAAITMNPEADSPEKTISVGKRFRELYHGTLILNNALTAESAAEAIEEGAADFVAFGLPFIANPDLVRRFLDGVALATPRQDSLYQGGLEGYIDYPFAQ